MARTKGSGPYGVETTPMRIPLPLVETVQKLLDQFKAAAKQQPPATL